MVTGIVTLSISFLLYVVKIFSDDPKCKRSSLITFAGDTGLEKQRIMKRPVI